jgi:hypothetical protein
MVAFRFKRQHDISSPIMVSSKHGGAMHTSMISSAMFRLCLHNFGVFWLLLRCTILGANCIDHDAVEEGARTNSSVVLCTLEV